MSNRVELGSYVSVLAIKPQPVIQGFYGEDNGGRQGTMDTSQALGERTMGIVNLGGRLIDVRSVLMAQLPPVLLISLSRWDCLILLVNSVEPVPLEIPLNSSNR